MIDEVYDVLDDNGSPVDQATWIEVHTKGLLHQVVHGVVFKDKSRKEILLKKRSKDAAQEPNVLEISVAGHIISGETPETAIRREIEEEILAGKPIPNYLQSVFLTSFRNNDLPNNHEIAYLYEIIYPGPVSIEKNEAQEMEWFDLDQVLKDINSNPHKFAVYSISAINEYFALKRQ